MGYPHQCSKRGCRKWVSLPKPETDYRRPKLCPGCGCDSLKSRVKTERAKNKRRNCYCDGWFWSMKGGPHRKGSAPWCHESTRDPTEEEINERYR